MINQRDLQDFDLLASTVLPNAAQTKTSGSIDLGPQPYVVVDQFELSIKHAAVAALADTKTHTYTLLESDDNNTFAAMVGGPTFVETGAGGVGVAAADYRVKLPPTVKRYIKVQVVGVALGGDASGVTAYLSLRH